MANVVGPGAVQDIDVNVQPLLAGATEYEFVTILNPLPDDFAIRVAQDVPVNMPQAVRSQTASVRNGEDMRRVYGDDFKNPDHQAKQHITNDVIIRSGQTINLKGNEAQVAVRQLVNEMLQREDQARLLADPTLRRSFEERIVIRRGSVQDLMDGKFNDLRAQATEAIKKSNQVNEDNPSTVQPGVTHEEEFPELNKPATGSPEGSGDTRTEGSDQPKRSPGRPKKTEGSGQPVPSQDQTPTS